MAIMPEKASDLSLFPLSTEVWNSTLGLNESLSVYK